MRAAAWAASTNKKRNKELPCLLDVKAFMILGEEATQNREKAVRPFVLCSLRHTFLTRLGESGCDAWTLARIAGHSNVSR